MASNNYWMKLWFDILRDPKMGMLPDRLWRRVIELFLLAGQNGEDGLLPDVATIAWQLNKPVSAIKTDLEKIAEIGIVQEIEEGRWIVTNFKKRNEPVTSAKRMKDFRMRERYEKSDENVTEVKRECDAPVTMRNQEEQKNRRTDINTSTTTRARDEIAEIVTVYESEIGALTPIITDDILSVIDDYPLDWFAEAFREAARNNKRSWKYALAILKRWKTDGFKVDGRQRNNAGYGKRASIGPDIPGYVSDKSHEEVVYDD